MLWIVSFVAALLCIFGFRFAYFYLCVRGKSERVSRKDLPLRLMVILGSGGHTTEALSLLSQMSASKYYPVTFVLADTDSTSAMRAAVLQRLDAETKEEAKFVKIPRSREVRQAWLSSAWSTLYATMYALPIVITERPDVILCNGPGTCVPICLVAWIFNIVGLRRSIITFVESICRVKSLSLSGKILYYVADVFFVQYQYLKERYPRAVFLGRLV
ncbi:UDP-N-acetylglucosamine transferase subunit ALG14 homolog [Paramacrobiotus metropolitanus]|uniref:UDP-N-acetylglucosamine transferase subunit ALG14 homolog n=1 Tax=Paramacrobiotus metropolitanus TaxID=2943436 RepID=UPI0024456186|nr:UDP-N-acetylglucosamine transferase subunit ALG14 homolog [Paramacrobiotus metropolitanus]